MAIILMIRILFTSGRRNNMDKDFKDIIQLLAKEQGKETLVNGKAKMFLSDYCKGQFKKETAIFRQILGANCGELINNADNVSERKQKLMALLEEDYSLSPKVTAEYLDLLGLILKGDASESGAQVQVTPVQAEQVQTAEKAAPSSTHTNGEITLKGGGVYEGDLLNGKPHGKGKMIKDEKIYEGDFVNGKLHGKGKMIGINDEVYEGDFVKGELHGKGKITTPGGCVDECDFVEGVMSGKGKETCADGTIYEGDFEKSLFHGKGKITYANGNVFEGDFEWGHGKGKMTYKNGKVKEGTCALYEFKAKGLFG